ncbi:MAG: PAS domain-containing protein [Proteobacteria bacterium]|nr:PAS domain-containing protein [Pseudomonadota bacterium]
MSLSNKDSKFAFDNHSWHALQLFNLYRVVLASGFVAFNFFQEGITLLGTFDESLYQQATYLYFAISIICLMISISIKKYFTWQANAPIFIDIIAIIVIMHAVGGLITGIGMLLVIIVAAHSLLVPGKLSYFSAALSAIGLLFEHSYSVFLQNNALIVYTQVGLLGVAIFVTASLTNILSLRARKSQLIVESQARQLATSQQLNAYIVSAMHAGVLVIDNQQHIRLANAAAKHLLGLPSNKPLVELSDLPPLFEECFKQWCHQRNDFVAGSMMPAAPEIRLSFHGLGKPLPIGTLIFIYNVTEETRHAQNIKLASLGHLTANIAHELRNPLGAASHAAQLLAETPHLTSEDYHLIEMIKNSCDRMNTVIQNVLSLSGRKPPQMKRIALIPWLEHFVKDLVIPHIPSPLITLEVEHKDIQVNIDPSQLTQILINLCENGLRYSLKKNYQATLTIRVTTTPFLDSVCIDVIDQGEGISQANAKHIFEPFFTTDKKGSGLGLYIAKELSQINGARLSHSPTEQGCQFRITLPIAEDNHDAAYSLSN